MTRMFGLLVLLTFFGACSDQDAPTEAVAEGSGSPTPDPVAPSWKIFRGDRGLSGVAQGSLSADLELAWTFMTEDAITSSPVVADGIVYIGSNDGSIYAIGLDDGKKRWAVATEDAVEAPPLILDGRIYVGSNDFFFRCLDAKTGKEIWKRETGDMVMGSATFVRPTPDTAHIVVGSYDFNLHCFDAVTGETQWTYETDNYINGTPALVGDSVAFGGCDCYLHLVSTRTGKLVEKIDLGYQCHVAGTAGAEGRRVYFGHYGNAFVCIDLDDVEGGWVYSNPRQAFFSSPAITADRVVFGGRDKKLHCVSKATGEVMWTFSTRRKVDGSPVVCDGKVVFGSGDGRVYMLNVEDGKELWHYEIGRAVFSSPAVVGGRVIIGAHDGGVYCFRAKK